jgi:hypothetical protein
VAVSAQAARSCVGVLLLTFTNAVRILCAAVGVRPYFYCKLETVRALPD